MSADAKDKYLDDAVVENAKWIDRVLMSGAGIAAVIVLLKLKGITEFEWLHIKFSTDEAWMVVLIVSIAHLYSAYLLVKSSHDLWSTKDSERRLGVFHTVTTKGGLFTRGMLARTKSVKRRGGKFVYEMKYDDPTTWLAYGAALGLILSVVPFNLSSLKRFVALGVLAIALCILNWRIGANWIVALSELTITEEDSHYFSRISERESLYRFNISSFAVMPFVEVFLYISTIVIVFTSIAAFSIYELRFGGYIAVVSKTLLLVLGLLLLRSLTRILLPEREGIKFLLSLALVVLYVLWLIR